MNRCAGFCGSPPPPNTQIYAARPTRISALRGRSRTSGRGRSLACSSNGTENTTLSAQRKHAGPLRSTTERTLSTVSASSTRTRLTQAIRERSRISPDDIRGQQADEFPASRQERSFAHIHALTGLLRSRAATHSTSLAHCDLPSPAHGTKAAAIAHSVS